MGPDPSPPLSPFTVTRDSGGRLTWTDADVRYRTDENGQGLWTWGPADAGWRQVHSPCRFSLCGLGVITALYRAIPGAPPVRNIA
jgi:acyl-coenzyme A synthetase/AMP-(fatty) acid ligase